MRGSAAGYEGPALLVSDSGAVAPEQAESKEPNVFLIDADQE